MIVARSGHRLEAIEKQLASDSLTGLRNRIGMETTLHEWWQMNRHRSTPICGAMFDLDGFGKVSDKHGWLVGDRILHHVGQLLLGATDAANLVARYGGQRFATVLSDSGPRAAVRMAEWFRQSLERATFRHEDKEILLTACGAVTEAKSDESYDRFLARLEETLNEAKRAGPNRSWLNDGIKAELIESPNLGAKYTEIAV